MPVLCDKQFIDRSYLKRHQCTHSGERPLPVMCLTNHSVTTSLGNLQIHEKVNCLLVASSCLTLQSSGYTVAI
jgi:hypothetical protein